MPISVFINSTPSDIGRETHNFSFWSDTEIVLSPINKQSLLGDNFYFKITDANDIESNWYGPIHISNIIHNELINIGNHFSNNNDVISNFSTLIQLSQLQSITGISWDPLKNVFINNTPSDIGRENHNFISWSNTEILLSPIDKSSIPGNHFYFKLVDINNIESNWYGPVIINEIYTGQIYNESINLSTSTSTISQTSDNIIDVVLSVSNSYSISNTIYDTPVTWEIRAYRIKLENNP